MRFMIMVEASPNSEAGVMPEDKLIAAMASCHEELAKAGVLLDASGLRPSAQVWRIQHSAGKRTVIDGPFAEAKELIAGYTLVQVESREEALAGRRTRRRVPGEGRRLLGSCAAARAQSSAGRR
jgi:hypothetical protein